jgi:hypothetical protein
MNPPHDDRSWRSRLIDRRLPWKADPIRPAEVGDELCKVALARENILEDAEYRKVSPNWFIVEVSQENYAIYYLPLESQLLDQWKDRLLNHLLTVNDRQGRSEFRFAGPVKLEIRPVAALKPNQARIHFRFQPFGPDQPSTGAAPADACLRSADGFELWPLRSRIVTIGRDRSCDIPLVAPDVQQKKLVSGRHAFILCQDGSYRLFDGSPDGRQSRNGTYVNLVRVTHAGVLLKDGDQILLAALDPARPDPHAAGVAGLWFQMECP